MRLATTVRAVMLTILLSVIGLAGCSLPTSGSSPVLVTSEIITLEWDAPTISYPFSPLSISAYYVYSRRHGASQWSFCGQAASNLELRYSLRHSEYGDGAFDFAVCAVDARGEQSPLHTSLDATASPYGGWYLMWIRSD